MLEAINVAKRKKIKLYLVDRDINDTMNDMINSMSLLEKIKLFDQLFSTIFGDEKISSEEIEKMKNPQNIDLLIKELSKATPNIKRVLVDKRNDYISEKIHEIKEKKILVFLGAGHVNGVKKNLFSKKTKKRVKKEKKKKWNIFNIVPLTIVLLLLFGFFKSPNVAGNMLITYVLTVMLGALIGGIVSLAHPISILAGAFTSPVTVIHPLLTSGMFSALFQAKQVPPRVKDLKNLPKIKGVRGIYKNKMSHLLLVFILVNFFTSIAVLVVFPLLIKILI